MNEKHVVFLREKLVSPILISTVFHPNRFSFNMFHCSASDQIRIDLSLCKIEYNSNWIRTVKVSKTQVLIHGLLQETVWVQMRLKQCQDDPKPRLKNLKNTMLVYCWPQTLDYKYLLKLGNFNLQKCTYVKCFCCCCSTLITGTIAVFGTNPRGLYIL